jgi:hypothetical protein
MNVTRELSALEKMGTKELKQKFEEVFREQARSGNRPWLIKRIIWRMQANAEGDLSERARRRAEELANDADLRLKPPKPKPIESPTNLHTDDRIPMPGTELAREYKGKTITVKILNDGFRYQNITYKSLSAVAKAITGSNWNGFHFFNLTGGAK